MLDPAQPAQVTAEALRALVGRTLDDPELVRVVSPLGVVGVSITERGGEALIEALRASLGASNTVWGIKQAEGRISWEFYFYDYERQHRQRSIPRVLAALAPRIRCTLAPGEQLPYFMFSLDFDHDRLAGRVPLEDVQVYIGNIGSRVSSGICYEATSGGLRLKNQYYFFDARTERENIAGKALFLTVAGGG